MLVEAVRLVDILKKRGLTIACAESLTGGSLGAALVDVVGVSEVFLASVVAYSDIMKMRLLGVSGGLLEKYGCVSSEVALDMALGVRRVSGSDVAVATTGVAGPGYWRGVAPGVVYIAFVFGSVERVVSFSFFGSRFQCGFQAVIAALKLAIAELKYKEY